MPAINTERLLLSPIHTGAQRELAATDAGLGAYQVLLRANNLLLGHCAVHYVAEDAGAWLEVEVTCSLPRALWGQGYAAEVVSALIEAVGFAKPHLRTVETCTYHAPNGANHLMKVMRVSGDVETFDADAYAAGLLQTILL